MTPDAKPCHTRLKDPIIPHPNDIKEPEIGALVDAYFVVSVGQAVGIFYSW
jgi:hypothetical protein